MHDPAALPDCMVRGNRTDGNRTETDGSAPGDYRGEHTHCALQRDAAILIYIEVKSFRTQ